MSFLLAFRRSLSLQGTTCCPCTQGTLWALTATSGSREPAPGRALPSAHPVKGVWGEAPGDTLGGTLAEPPTNTTAQSGPRGPQNSPISPGSPQGPPNPEAGAVTRSLHHLHAVSGLPRRLQHRSAPPCRPYKASLEPASRCPHTSTSRKLLASPSPARTHHRGAAGAEESRALPQNSPAEHPAPR